MVLRVPPSTIVIVTQIAKASLVALVKKHPRKNPGYGFCVTRTEGLVPAGRDVRRKRIKDQPVVLTTNPPNKPVQKYHVGDLAESKEQSEADSNSLIPLPNRIRSDSKNDCHHERTESC